MSDFSPLSSADAHVEWGPAGASLAADRGDVVVVVDVMSFSTTIVMALDAGIQPVVASPQDIAALGGIDRAAAAHHALATRPRGTTGAVTLSPASFTHAAGGQRYLFTSLNGAAVTCASAGSTATLIGSLRNLSACADAATELATTAGAQITIIAASETWPSGTDRRPAIEDLYGAGAIAARLGSRGASLSVEARAAEAVARNIDPEVLHTCVSARELISKGYSDDVQRALEVDSSQLVPVLSRGADPVFVALNQQARRPQRS